MTFCNTSAATGFVLCTTTCTITTCSVLNLSKRDMNVYSGNFTFFLFPLISTRTADPLYWYGIYRQKALQPRSLLLPASRHIWNQPNLHPRQLTLWCHQGTSFPTAFIIVHHHFHCPFTHRLSIVSSTPLLPPNFPFPVSTGTYLISPSIRSPQIDNSISISVAATSSYRVPAMF